MVKSLTPLYLCLKTRKNSKICGGADFSALAPTSGFYKLESDSGGKYPAELEPTYALIFVLFGVFFYI